MGTVNIVDLGKNVQQGTSAVNAVSSITEEEQKISFLDMMSQFAAQPETELFAQKQSSHNAQQTSKEYGTNTYRENDIKDGTSLRTDISSKTASEKMETYADDVKEVLKEELGVTDEQIETALENLGLSFVDLMNPKALAELVMQLTQTNDFGKLLCNSEFMEVMQAVSELTESLLQELGITAEDLKQMLQTAEPTLDNTAIPKESQATANENATAATETTSDEAKIHSQTLEKQADESSQETADAGKDIQMAATGENAETNAEKDVQSQMQEKTNDSKSVNESSEDGLAEEEEEIPEMKTASEHDASKGNAFSDNSQSQDTNPQAAVAQNQPDTSYAVNSEANMNFSQQVDVANIIRQIAEFSRVIINNAETTMEMQLNPENLGKIYLEVTSKAGIVSAHIMAQNEVVKEALETQLVELRQNMNQAGIKVDAVEVTIGSHEFERNLEQNGKQDEQNAQEQEKNTKRTRQINRNDLDELSKVMSEEETLVAQMMAEQGNSIDYTA